MSGTQSDAYPISPGWGARAPPGDWPAATSRAPRRRVAAAGAGRGCLSAPDSDTATPSGRSRARSRRARSRAANPGSGSAGVTGARSTRNGSAIAVLLSVTGVHGTERRPRPHEQRLRGVHGAAEQVGDLRYRQVVHVAQGERGPV